MPDKDVLIPIVFPEFKISTPYGKLPFLGHAGILIILGKTGTTKYFEYGRYDPPANKGLVRQRTIPDVKVDASGQLDLKSLALVLHDISKQSGQSGKIEATYIEIAHAYQKALQYSERRFKQNSDPKRAAYGLTDNNCITFVKDALEAGGVDTPWMLDPRPNSYIDELQDDFRALSYDPRGDKLWMEPTDFAYQYFKHRLTD